MDEILAKLPEYERGCVQRVLDLINDSSGMTRRIFCSRLYGIADMLLTIGRINVVEYIFMTKIR